MTLPFLDKALHIDDPVYIYVARQILEDPTRPFNFDLNWFGITTNALHSHNHPPLLSYYFSPFLAWFGESEMILHGCLIVFPLIAAYSVYFLAQRFSPKPLAAASTVVLSPAFFVAASTLMLDIPVLACTLAATCLFIYGLDQDRPGTLALSGLVLGAACLIKYSAIIQFGVLWFYAFLHGKVGKAWVPLGLAFLIVAGWVAALFLATGAIHPLLAMQLEGVLAMSRVQSLLALISYTGAAVFVAGCISFPAKRWRMASLGLSLLIGGSVFFQSGELNKVSRLLLFVFTFNGVYLLALVSSGWPSFRKSENRDTMFLQMWFGAGVAFVALLIAFNAVRHVLIFLVPLVLLIFRSCQASVRFEKVYPLNLALLFIISLCVSYGDYTFANSYRKFAGVIYQEVKKSSQNPTVWHRTHWGFQYYMEHYGARFLEPKNVHEVREGDWFVETLSASQNIIPPSLIKSLTPLRIYYAHGWPFRLMDRSLGAGWYSQWWGLLPFTLDIDTPIETLAIYQINDLNKSGPQ